MTRDESLIELKDIIICQQNQHIDIDENTRLGDVVGINCITLSSLEYVELIVEIENRFNVIVDFDVDLFVIKDIIDYIIHYSENAFN